MKVRLCLALAALALGVGPLHGAGADRPEAETTTPGAVLERGPHHNVLRTVRLELDGDGQEVPRPTRVVQLEDSLNYWDEDREEWAPSVAEIKLVRGIGVARRGPQQALFAPNANDPEGAVTIATRDGTTLRSSVLALAYFDTASGQEVILATVQDAVGELLPPNRVLYREALSGLVRADLLYEYRQTGVQQVVLLSEAPPDPEEFGLLAEATRLEVLSEFFEAPTPTRRPRVLERVEDPGLRAVMAEPDWVDETLDFGPFRMAEGRALSLRDWLGSGGGLAAVPIGKRWSVDTASGRVVLYESADYWSLARELAELPAADGRPQRVREARSKDPREAALNRLAALSSATNAGPQLTARSLPARPQGVRTAATARPSERLSPGPSRPPVGDSLRLAAEAGLPRKPGLVLDWSTLNSSQSDYLFQGDTTYYVSGPVELSGTSILEAGAVLKYTNSANAGLRFTTPGAVLQCRTAPGRPAVFTSKNDNTVGEVVPGTTGDPSTPGTATSFLWFDSAAGAPAANLSHVRFSRAGMAAVLVGGTGHRIRHAQLDQCLAAVYLSGAELSLQNVLLLRGGIAFWTRPYDLASVSGEQVTIHQMQYWKYQESGLTASLVNSLVVSVTNYVSYTGINTATLATDHGVFVAEGAGGHYLAAGSPYRNAGTPDLAAELKRLTTYPPLALSNVTLNAAVTWGPQAARDTDLPDLGYHYEPMDYAVDQVAVGMGGELAILPGTVIGTFGCHGLVAEDYGKITAVGSPLQPVRFLHYTATQERGQAWGCTNNAPNLLIGPPHNMVAGSQSPEIELRFVEFSQLGGRGLGLALFNAWFAVKRCRVEDCQFYGTGNHFAAGDKWESWIDLRNNLFHRTANQFYGWVHLTAYNNLFWAGTNYIQSNYGGNYPWYFHDNAFHSTGLNPNSQYNEYAKLIRSHSGYLGPGQATLNGLTTGDVVVSNFPYSAGPLGAFYQGLTSLINVGSRSREAAGLYHFTIKPGLNTKEGADSPATVDIGFHYAGVNAASQPLDFDLDGLPDWYEDRNGDNLSSSGETALRNPTDAGLRVWITRPAGGAPIP